MRNGLSSWLLYLVAAFLSYFAIVYSQGGPLLPRLLLVAVSGTLATAAHYLARDFRKRLTESRDRQGQQLMEELRRSGVAPSSPPFALFLRPFDSTGRLLAENPDAREGVPATLSPGGWEQPALLELESSLREATAAAAPLLGLGQAGESFGAGRIETAEESWQEDLIKLTEHSALFLVLPALNPGTLWEIRLLRRRKVLHKTVFLMPPAGTSEGYPAEALWEEMRQVLGQEGLTFPRYDPRGALFTVDEEHGVQGSVPWYVGSPRALARSLRRLTPALALWKYKAPRSWRKPLVASPHPLALFSGMIVAGLLLSYLVPLGNIDQNVWDPTPEQSSPLAAFTAVPRGFARVKDLIFFVFIAGGTWRVFRATGAADAANGALLRIFGRRPAWLVLGGMFIFAVGSSTLGMAAEYLLLMPVLLALCAGFGFDAVVAAGVLCVGYGAGLYLASPVELLQIWALVDGQAAAELTPKSGLWLRLAVFPVFLAVGFHHVWRYAKRIKAEPWSSLVAGQDAPIPPDPDQCRFRRSHAAPLAAALAALALLVYGAWQRDLATGHPLSWTPQWYLVEMGALLLGLTAVLGLAARIRPDDLAQEFADGAAEVTTAALLVGFAGAIQLVLSKVAIHDLVIYVMTPVAGLGAEVMAVGMFLVVSASNLFYPSSAAYQTIQVMALLGEEAGPSPEVVLLAHQFGGGFTDILVPTNAVLVAILAMAGVPYDRWLRFILPFMIKVWAIASLVLVIAVLVKY